MVTLDNRFRRQAKYHRDAARRHLSDGCEDMVFAAALRLRMAVECLAYEILQSFGDELSQEIMETWQPGKLIKELKEIDDSVDRNMSIRMGKANAPDQPADELIDLGSCARLSAAWISKEYNALGSYLHTPTIKQLKNGKTFDVVKSRERIEEVLVEIDRVLDSRVFHVNIRPTITVICRCGFSVSRRESLLRKERQVTCANCHAVLGVDIHNDEWHFFEFHHNFVCPECQRKNRFPAKELKDGANFTCDYCGALVGVEKDWHVRVMKKPQSSR